LKARRDPVPLDISVKLVAILSDAVGHAHSRGLLHRDLKPANILLRRKSEIRNPKSETNPKPEIPRTETPGAPRVGFKNSDFEFVSDFEFRFSDFEPKITDFGLAKLVTEGEGLAPSPELPPTPGRPLLTTRLGAVLGTPLYMAPEQVAGRLTHLGPATDTYALGVILYETLTGKPPFWGQTEAETFQLILTAQPTPPGQLRLDTSPDLEAICLRCLEKDPDRRYTTARALAEDLREIQCAEGGVNSSSSLRIPLGIARAPADR
jgi:serine/threonine protein kinase